MQNSRGMTQGIKYDKVSFSGTKSQILPRSYQLQQDLSRFVESEVEGSTRNHALAKHVPEVMTHQTSSTSDLCSIPTSSNAAFTIARALWHLEAFDLSCYLLLPLEVNCTPKNPKP